jgi:hypothetical protein
LQLDDSTFPALWAEEVGAHAPQLDEHGAPAGVFVAALDAFLAVVNVLPLLTDNDRPITPDGPPFGETFGGRRRHVAMTFASCSPEPN